MIDYYLVFICNTIINSITRMSTIIRSLIFNTNPVMNNLNKVLNIKII